MSFVCCPVLHCAALSCAVPCCAVLCCIVYCCSLRYCAVQCSLHKVAAIALHCPLLAVMLAYSSGCPEHKRTPSEYVFQAAVGIIIILQCMLTALVWDAHPLCNPALVCAQFVATLLLIAADHHSKSRTCPQDEDSASAAADPCDYCPRGAAELPGR